MSFLDSTNKLALEFNRETAAKMNEIMQPLRSFGITQFTFCRSFRDGKRLYLSGDSQWVEYYLKHKFQDETDHLEHYIPPAHIRYSFWSGFKGDKVFDGLYNYEVGHGFAIYEHYANYVEQFDFATHRENYQMTNFYMKNLPFLEEFVKNFKMKAADLINVTARSKFIIPSKKICFKNIPCRSFISPRKIESFMTCISEEMTKGKL